FWAFCCCGAGAVCWPVPAASGPAAARTNSPEARSKYVFIIDLPWLRDDIDERGLALLDDVKGTLERGTELVRIADRTFRVDAHPFHDLRVIDERILQRRADVRARDAAVVPVA